MRREKVREGVVEFKEGVENLNRRRRRKRLKIEREKEID